MIDWTAGRGGRSREGRGRPKGREAVGRGRGVLVNWRESTSMGTEANPGSRATVSHLRDTELADRWGVDVEDVREMVRNRNVPYVWVGRGDKPNLSRISWRYVRFRVSAIERWEVDQERTMGDRGSIPKPAVDPAEGLDLIRGGWKSNG